MKAGKIRSAKFAPEMAKYDLPEDKVCLISEDSYKSPQDLHAEITKTNGVSVVWKNLRVNAVVKTEHIFRPAEHQKKEIIRNVDGRVQPNSLVAIMGASGSGKSTLMSVLANRQPGDLETSGDIRINGQKMQLKYMRRISGYVYQDDLFIPTLTVSEHMHLAAKLKLDQRINESRRSKIINDLLTAVGLTKCAQNRIGSSSFGTGKVNLSGGEQKRLSVATELLTDPPLLFCDEPTTGLDSYSAMKLISVMKDLTEQRNKTIICSIHQPSEQLFGFFHQVILLYSGRIAFSGTPNNATEFFKSLGYKFIEGQNSAEFLVKSLAVVPGHESATTKQAADICKRFNDSQYAIDIHQYIEKETQLEDSNYLKPPKIQKRSWFYMFYLMLQRDILAIIKDPTLQGLAVVYRTCLGLLIGICFGGTVTLTQEGVQSLKGVIFIMVIENFASPVYASLQRIPGKMPIFLREYTNNLNSPSVFYLTTVISITPGMILDATIFTTLIYWISGLKADLFIYGMSVLVNAMVLNISSAYGTFLSVLTNSYASAQVVVLPLNMIFCVLSGTIMNLRTAPWFITWFRYVSWMTLSIETLLILQVYDINYIACPSNPEQPCLKNGEDILTQLDFSTGHLARNLITMISTYLAFHVLAFCLFYVKVYLKTRSKLIKR